LVLRRRHGPVLELCLANPPFNGLTGPLLRAYLDALEDARLDDAVRALVTTSAAGVWCAGGGEPDTMRRIHRFGELKGEAQ